MAISIGKAPYEVQAQVTWSGADVAVVISGGTAPHIGAVALASPRPSLKQDGTVSASASVLCRLGHKDDLPARDAAIRLAATLNTNVLVSVGIHIDGATADELQILEKNYQLLLEQLVKTLAK